MQKGQLMARIAANPQVIGNALAQLPAEYRTVLLSSYYEAKTTAQIAADLHTTDDAVKSMLHHAMRRVWLSVQEHAATA